MATLQHFSNQSEREHQLAVSAFVAGLPDFCRGRLVLTSSEPDSWRHKPPAIQRRMAAARAWRPAP